MSSVATSPATPKAERDRIWSELQENGSRKDTKKFGFHLDQYIGFEMQISSAIAMGRFTVSEKTCQPHGVLHGGVTAFIAESLASFACAHSINGVRVAGVEMNVNHLRSVSLGTEVTVIAKALMQGSKLQVWEVRYEIDHPNNTKSSSPSEEPDTLLTAVARVTLITGLNPKAHSLNVVSRM